MVWSLYWAGGLLHKWYDPIFLRKTCIFWRKTRIFGAKTHWRKNLYFPLKALIFHAKLVFFERKAASGAAPRVAPRNFAQDGTSFVEKGCVWAEFFLWRVNTLLWSEITVFDQKSWFLIRNHDFWSEIHDFWSEIMIFEQKSLLIASRIPPGHLGRSAR